MSEYGDRAAMSRAEASYLSPPEPATAPGAEDALDMVIFFPATFEPGTTVAELIEEYDSCDNPTDEDLFGIVENYEVDGEAYEGIEVGLEIRSLTSKRTCSISLDHLNEYIVPEGPLRRMGESAERVYRAERAARERRREYERSWPFIRYELERIKDGSVSS